jgi:hypothetical protein
LVAGGAFAQPNDLSCEIFGTQQNVRAEGKTELLGDIVIECVASDPLAPAPWDSRQVNIIVNLPVNVTNNIDFGQGEDTTDARLIVNDDYGNGLYGVRTANREIAFDDVTVPFPGFGGGPATTEIRISSIRGNVTQLGLPSEGNVIQIDAIVSTEPPQTLSVGVPSVTIGFSRLSLISDGVSDAVNGLQCVDLEEETAYLNIREGFASAWKTQGVPSDAKGTFWESGIFANGSNNDAGASQETQFRMSFGTIPDDVSLALDEQITDGDDLVLTLLSVNGDSVNDLCGGTPGDLVSVDHEDGDAVAIYGVCDNDPNAREELAIPLHLEWDVDDTPDVGAGTVTISYYPLNGSDFSDYDDPEPRFVDTASTPEEFVSVVKCVTTILFPFVTNQSGFDTGLAISNTSEDWGLSGIDGQDGACEVHYIGTDTSDNTPEVDVTTDDVLAGEQLVWLLSAGGSHGLVGAPDFQGYVLAACDFQYAHGYAFITDGFGGGIPALAQGYLALIIPANREISNGDAESLGH